MLNTMQSVCMKNDNDKDCSWSVIEKHVVLTEVRGFGDPHIDKTTCLQIIKKLLYLLNQGEIFTKSEAADILSSAVNVYRFQDVHLRRLFHLIARDLCPIADEVSLVTGALLKDVNNGNVAYQANAIRLLYHITNDTSLNKVVKLLHEALCDDNPSLQIASLVCSINMLKRDPRMVITIDQVYPEDTVFTKGKHVQFHAIYLEFVMGELRHTREERRERFYLIWEKLARLYSWCSSPLGTYILIRGIQKATRVRRVYWTEDIYECIESCINAKDKMVAIEGFRTLEGVTGISRGIIEDNIDVMRPNLRSHQRVVRFSARRALQKVGIVHNLGLDVNFFKLGVVKFNHREDVPEHHQGTQVIKAVSFGGKEASTRCDRSRPRLVIWGGGPPAIVGT